MAKVLLVEDDNNLREIYEARLTAEGYDILTAQNGEEALSVAKQQKPDLVISDVMMPRISGFEMLDILRNTDELKNTKVIMLTALGQAEDRGRADNLGADKYLVKSQVTLEDIVNAAKALLADEPGGVTTPSLTAPPTTDPIAPTSTDYAPATTPPDPVVTSVAATATNQSEITPATGESQQAPNLTTPPITTQPIAEPILPTSPVAPATIPEPVTTPVAASTPIAAPTTNPPDFAAQVTPANIITQPIAATVTVADPDPITPHTSPAAEPLTVVNAQPSTPPTPLSEIIAAAEAGITTETTQQQVPVVTTEPPTQQSLAAEEAAIEAQIAAFSATDEPTEPMPTPAQINNDAILNEAVNRLGNPEAIQPAQTTSTEPVPSTPVSPQPDLVAPSPADSPSDSTSQIAGRKVIQPINNVEAGTPNLEDLLAKEEAKEAAEEEANPQPIVIDSNPNKSPQQSSVDPNTIAL